MQEWIHRIIAARDPDWRSFSREPMTAAAGAPNETPRREK